MEVNGWRLVAAALAASQPKSYSSHPAAKLLATIHRYIMETIPRDPLAREFRLGNSLGPDNRHWFRAKFHERYRLFFRFSSGHKIIVYAWINDESSLRKAGSRNDPYALFRRKMESGDLPSSFDDLVKKARPL